MSVGRWSRYALAVPLIALAIVARDWAEKPDTFELEETVDMRASEADYYLEDFTTRRFDAGGALEYVVSGRTLSHFPDDDRSEVDAPRVELHRADGRWRVSAERGRLDTDPDVFTLLGAVRLEREGTPPDEAGAEAEAGAALTIRTSDLSLGLDSNELATDAAFEIVSPGWRLAGVGLRSRIDEGKLVLLSDVTGTYDAAVLD